VHPDVGARRAEAEGLEVVVVVHPEQLRTEPAGFGDEGFGALSGLELRLGDPQAVDGDRLDQAGHAAAR